MTRTDDARRVALRERLLAVTRDRYERRILTAWTEEPGAALAEAEREVAAALADRRTLAETLWTLGLLARDRRAGQLSNALRVGLLTRVSQKRLTTGRVHGTLDLLAGSEAAAEREALVADLLDPAPRQSLAGVHAVLLYALREVPEPWWPETIFHGDEDVPEIGAANYAVLARELASALDPLYAEALERLQLAADNETRQKRPDQAGASLRPAVGFTARTLVGADDRAGCDALLVTLDAALRRLDVVNALTKRKKEPGQPVARCLWRGTDADGAALWLAGFEGGTSGLLRKVGRRWQWFEGPRDEVLANLPGERFEEIVASLS